MDEEDREALVVKFNRQNLHFIRDERILCWRRGCSRISLAIGDRASASSRNQRSDRLNTPAE